ncbi:hypothetical protein [Actinoplanes sp. M2I2]|uniref:hypothetical protein n=1 Tax=Actinoplanes sp. M2I2 TaxID=1734444 RepID=UPI00202085ED|nr:hypothetical protein [Actinoplanes sp. M2I2]
MILTLGLHPSAIDYTRHPGLDEVALTARIAAGEAAVRAAGFDIVSCQVPADPAAAETLIRERVATHPIGGAMIGAGLRTAPEHTLLFERAINVLTTLVPGVVLCFNTSPETTIDALRRCTASPRRPG